MHPCILYSYCRACHIADVVLLHSWPQPWMLPETELITNWTCVTYSQQIEHYEEICANSTECVSLQSEWFGCEHQMHPFTWHNFTATRVFRVWGPQQSGPHQEHTAPRYAQAWTGNKTFCLYISTLGRFQNIWTSTCTSMYYCAYHVCLLRMMKRAVVTHLNSNKSGWWFGILRLGLVVRNKNALWFLSFELTFYNIVI